MKLTMRWYGPQDSIPLHHFRQVPGVTGIVSALYNVEVGEVWPVELLQKHQKHIETAGLRWDVIESIPVPDGIKLGLKDRDRLIENYQQSIRNMAQVGLETLCYNFMPVFDWTRTDLSRAMQDGSTTLEFVQQDLDRIDLTLGTHGLPGWADVYTPEELQRLLEQYRELGEEGLFENYAYFLKAVVPIAQEVGVKMAVHPDDPPWSILGLPRIVRDQQTMQRILEVIDSPSHGLTFCTGSLGSSPQNKLPEMVRLFKGRIHFVHARNVKVHGDRSFYETEHPSPYGDVNMLEVFRALDEVGFAGPIRSDHGRMIWGETGKPGYGLYDRALGTTYLLGLIEGLQGTPSIPPHP
ncbi:mannonate dehydratase [Deinococcus cellulosilyticus]|uniref:Mannonate dehydratase n=1 Tax=Deinococcus cellulosilyticus (strain DSM 18568 / NBRC 106333 / KACC 11606 / 5516J-15) TaxID=1223518 RepID=A0A511N0E5_DEIC1|nr:mannonate dehydratase [Deinococcus cellulosilyticus]GEM46322.1 mannonate dehydratase [Deinococcus cellulosilyticus NBRC 106333 = KACC 11606]